MSKPNGPTILILGAPASGKTTLAIALRDFLRSRGFADVRVDDEDISLGSAYEELQPERMRAVSARAVSIVTSSRAFALRPVSGVRAGDNVVLQADVHHVDAVRYPPPYSKAEHLSCDPPLPVACAQARSILVELQGLDVAPPDVPGDAMARHLVGLVPAPTEPGTTKRFSVPPLQAPAPGTYRVEVDGLLYTLVVRQPPRGPEGGSPRCPCVITCDARVGGMP